MTTFDPEATIERAAQMPSRARWMTDREILAAALSTIAADVLAPIEAALHEPVSALQRVKLARQSVADIKAKAGVR